VGKDKSILYVLIMSEIMLLNDRLIQAQNEITLLKKEIKKLKESKPISTVNALSFKKQIKELKEERDGLRLALENSNKSLNKQINQLQSIVDENIGY